MSQPSAAFIKVQEDMLMTKQLLGGALKNCHPKCINRDYREGEMHKGESVCVDRCVSKFLESNIYIMKHFNKQQQQMQQEEAA
eukprot:jgi/Hompol1/3474/HPOL_006571-RA